MSALQWNILQSGTIDQIEFIGSPVSHCLASRGTNTIVQPQPASACLGWAGLAGLGWLIQFLCPQCEQRGGGCWCCTAGHPFLPSQGPGAAAGRRDGANKRRPLAMWAPVAGVRSCETTSHQHRGPARGSTPARGHGATIAANTCMMGADTADNNMHAVMLEDLPSFSAFHCQLFTSGLEHNLVWCYVGWHQLKVIFIHFMN